MLRSAMPRENAASLHAEAWAKIYERIDRQLAPLGLAAIEALAPQAGNQILEAGAAPGRRCCSWLNASAPGAEFLCRRRGHADRGSHGPLAGRIAR